MRRRAMVGVAFLLVSLVVFATAGASATSSAVSLDHEEAFLARIAEVRSGADGRSPYAVSADLVDVARNHARDMQSQQRLHHNPRLGDDVSGWQSVGENVGVGASVDEIHRAFMESASHREAILSGTFTQVGVGVVVDGPDLWVVQVFRKPTAAPAPAPAPVEARPAPPSEGTEGGDVRAAGTGSARGGGGGGRPLAAPSVAASESAPVPAPARVASTAPAPPPAPTFDEEAFGAAFSAALEAPAVVSAAPRDRPDQAMARSVDTPRDVTLPIGVAAGLLVVVVGGLALHVAREQAGSAADGGRARSSIVDAWELALAA